MSGKRLLLASLIFVMPCAAEWTTAQREWALGTSAILNQMDGDRFDLLAGSDNPDTLHQRRDSLDRVWGIDSKEQLIETIDSLLAGDADQMQIGWNYPRAVNLARWGYAVGYLQEDEAWRIILPAAQRLQQTFGSWQEMGQAYLDARQKWFANRLDDRRRTDYAYRALLFNASGPWRKYRGTLTSAMASQSPAKAENPRG
jgi:hypothetical protein